MFGRVWPGKGRKAMKITRKIRITRKDVPKLVISTVTPPPAKPAGPAAAPQEPRKS